MKGQGKRESHEKTRRAALSPDMFLTCVNLGVESAVVKRNSRVKLHDCAQVILGLQGADTHLTGETQGAADVPRISPGRHSLRAQEPPRSTVDRAARRDVTWRAAPGPGSSSSASEDRESAAIPGAASTCRRLSRDWPNPAPRRYLTGGVDDAAWRSPTEPGLLRAGYVTPGVNVSNARLHHRGSQLDPRSDLRSTQKTVAPFEFRAGLEIERKFISKRRNWRFEILIRDQQPSSKNVSERARKTGDPRENPPTSGIVQHDSHMRKPGSDSGRIRTRFAFLEKGEGRQVLMANHHFCVHIGIFANIHVTMTTNPGSDVTPHTSTGAENSLQLSATQGDVIGAGGRLVARSAHVVCLHVSHEGRASRDGCVRQYCKHTSAPAVQVRRDPGTKPMRVFEVNMEWRRNEGAGEAGDPREKTPTGGIIRHDSCLRKSRKGNIMSAALRSQKPAPNLDISFVSYFIGSIPLGLKHVLAESPRSYDDGMP
ncbi:hypothetical protein PR048_031033 [Dryococelus australis]|uniref:Uncharacterized protein n=1 Tax=Dryococelus australis TaxID=614101 RepID=A0ABQ9G448_9NEOP|nr:hypothetical protein PR048_031033 [Dryococelus australis]